MKFHTTFYVLAAVVATALATVTDVENDFQNIAAQVTSLNTIYANFPTTGGSVSTAQSIHTGSVNLVQAIDKGTADLKAISGTLSETDALSILNAVAGMQPISSDSLTNIVKIRDALAELQISNITAQIYQDLKNLELSSSAFVDALKGAVPADLQSTIKNDVSTAFAPAISAYSS